MRPTEGPSATRRVRRSARRFAALAAVLALASAALPPRLAHAQTPALPDGFRDSVMVRNLNEPVGLAFVPGGNRLLVVEQRTRFIRLVVNGVLSTTDPVGQVDSVQTNGPEQGLLGIAVDPGFPARPYVYVHCDNLGNQTIRISRYTLAGDLDFTGNGALTLVAGSRRDILRDLPDVASNHNGGTLRFGADGYLYDSIGEDANPCAAQDTSGTSTATALRGKILRLDVSNVPAGGGAPPALSTITPPTNPFVATNAPRSRLIWTYGLRNPFRFHVVPGTSTLVIGDVGDGTWEEVDIVSSGGLNLGWPLREGFANHAGSCSLLGTATAPVYVYNHSDGIAIIGGPSYHAANGLPAGFPEAYEGDVFLSDYYTGFVRRLENVSGTWTATTAAGSPNGTDWALGYENVSDWMVGPDGMLWYVRQFDANFNDVSGSVGAIAGGGSAPPPPPPPADTTDAFAIGKRYPVPSNGTFSVEGDVTGNVTLTVTVHALDGRLVRHVLGPRDFTSGPVTLTWDGLDDDGRKAPSGVYLFRIEGRGFDRTFRVPLVR